MSGKSITGKRRRPEGLTRTSHMRRIPLELLAIEGNPVMGIGSTSDSVTLQTNHPSNSRRCERFPSPLSFMNSCRTCGCALRHDADVFVYRGDIAFCSEVCRAIYIDEDTKQAPPPPPPTTLPPK